ncbi:hypothetical protein GGTG_10867 [Gaeumannomyces tritici R3-111a-1]|uniref:Uncharacterized protein n=1 Tax=Gaeumannomyces tritici (strain R3-111a-1) TaxID=644352 RepID=J3PBJ5_GAET3|nr:hypothetical protein GGTG_10867 [Gaeumannomyces tritici R3-111a-1]EJT71612.1 hypothetical protein GGTG_10867 [Gaeumannomyces tritici R3-111a-1]
MRPAAVVGPSGVRSVATTGGNPMPPEPAWRRAVRWELTRAADRHRGSDSGKIPSPTLTVVEHKHCKSAVGQLIWTMMVG